jgi:23S rRNA (cytosine1962-C5)-methyltransferase
MFPTIQIKKAFEDKIKSGLPWIFANQVIETSVIVTTEKGETVWISDSKGKIIATGYCNPQSNILIRVITTKKVENIAEIIEERILKAAAKRGDEKFCRLIHSEGDYLPGIIIDRFGSVFSVQLTTAGMERFKDNIIALLKNKFQAEIIVLKNNLEARRKEGISTKDEVINFTSDKNFNGEITVIENEIKYLCNLINGQKTGWYFDQKENHAWAKSIAKGKNILDVFCYNGGFGIAAAMGGAKSVTFIDDSKTALDFARKNIEINNLKTKSEFIDGDAFNVLQQLAKEEKTFDVIILDPPPFIKDKRNKESGKLGYRKLVSLALPMVEDGGILFIASCSHHMSMFDLEREVMVSASKCNKQAEIIYKAGAASDHPIHKLLPQTEYLHALAIGVREKS